MKRLNIILESNKVVNSILDSSESSMELTGFGKLSQVKIPKDKLIELQENLILSFSWFGWSCWWWNRLDYAIY